MTVLIMRMNLTISCSSLLQVLRIDSGHLRLLLHILQELEEDGVLSVLHRQTVSIHSIDLVNICLCNSLPALRQEDVVDSSFIPIPQGVQHLQVDHVAIVDSDHHAADQLSHVQPVSTRLWHCKHSVLDVVYVNMRGIENSLLECLCVIPTLL